MWDSPRRYGLLNYWPRRISSSATVTASTSPATTLPSRRGSRVAITTTSSGLRLICNSFRTQDLAARYLPTGIDSQPDDARNTDVERDAEAIKAAVRAAAED